MKRDIFQHPFIDDLIHIGRSEVWVIDITADKVIIFIIYNGVKDKLYLCNFNRDDWRSFWIEYKESLNKTKEDDEE